MMVLTGGMILSLNKNECYAHPVGMAQNFFPIKNERNLQ